MSELHRFNLLPIIRDLEIMLLRKLVLREKQKEHNQKLPVAKIITAGRKAWKDWPKHAKSNNADYSTVRAELREYLEKQLTSQVCEVIELSEDNLQRYIEQALLDRRDRELLEEYSQSYGLRCRYFPAYLPDMQHLQEYTLRAAENAAGRELLEAINVQFFHRLMLRPDLLAELNLQNGNCLVELSAPKPREGGEIFLRIWELVNVPELGPRWQVTNFSLPFTNSTYMQSVRRGFKTIETAASLGLANLPIPENLYRPLGEVVIMHREELDGLMHMVSPGFPWQAALLTGPSDFIRQLVAADLKSVDRLLNEIIANLTKNIQKDYLQAWEQLLLVLVARHSSPNVFKDRLDETLARQDFLRLQDNEALKEINERHFDRFVRRHKLPRWLEMKHRDLPKMDRVTIDDLHSNFYIPVVAQPIAAATLGRELVMPQ